MKTALLAALSLIVQRALCWPDMPSWAGLVVLPVIWVVGPAMLRHDRRWVLLALILGLGWDLVLEPVIGPGGIAWSASALALSALASIVADRSPKAWFAFGALATVLVVTVRALALLPLGLPAGLGTWQLPLSALATGVWCGLVAVVRSLDLPTRLRVWRARRLR